MCSGPFVHIHEVFISLHHYMMQNTDHIKNLIETIGKFSLCTDIIVKMDEVFIL